ncbi:hypothetical protein Tco_0813398 [Tanacetum coccineum]
MCQSLRLKTPLSLDNIQTQESKVDTGKAVDVDLVITESNGSESEVKDDSSRSGNDTDANGADIKHIYDEEPMAEVQLTAELMTLNNDYFIASVSHIIGCTSIDPAKSVLGYASGLTMTSDIAFSLLNKLTSRANPADIFTLVTGMNAQNESNLSITSNDINIELSNEFLRELQKNAYHGWIDEDVVNHIAKLAIVLQKAKHIQDFGPTSGIRASRGTLISAAEIHAVEKERKARTILLMAIPKNTLRKIHGIETSSKRNFWEANKGLGRVRKGDMTDSNDYSFPQQLEAHGAEVSTEDANHKELTSTSKSYASAQNVAFVSHSKSSANKVKSGHTGAYTTYTPSTYSNNIPEKSSLCESELFAGLMDDGVVNWGEHIVEEVRQNQHSTAISSIMRKQKILGKDSSKNLWKLVNSGMSSNSKVGLGYGIKSNNEVLSYEEEMNRTVFNCTEEDFVEKPLYNRFSKTDNLKGVPHPLTRDYTPKPQ